LRPKKASSGRPNGDSGKKKFHITATNQKRGRTRARDVGVGARETDW